MARQAMTPAEPSQYAAVTSHRIAGGGGFRAWTMPSSRAELARMTGMDTATTMTANPNRKASDARRRVVPPPRGPRTTARSRRAVRGPAAGAPCPARAAMRCLPVPSCAFPTAARRTAAGPSWVTSGGMTPEQRKTAGRKLLGMPQPPGNR